MEKVLEVELMVLIAIDSFTKFEELADVGPGSYDPDPLPLKQKKEPTWQTKIRSSISPNSTP